VVNITVESVTSSVLAGVFLNVTTFRLFCHRHRAGLLVLSTTSEGGKNVSEIKGSKLPTETLGHVVENVSGIVYNDKTLERSHLPWQSESPVQYTLHDVNPDVGIEALGGIVGELQAPETIQIMSLLSVLNPLFASGQFDIEQVERINVCLDATIWKQPATRVESSIDSIASLPVATDFQTADSKSVAGLQVADLIAYTWRRHLRSGDCQTGVRAIKQARLSNRW